jgi:ferredoxin
LCGKCAEVCPQHAITYGPERALISKDCFGCGLCVKGCATDAIKIVLQEPLKARVEDYFTGLKIDVSN